MNKLQKKVQKLMAEGQELKKSIDARVGKMHNSVDEPPISDEQIKHNVSLQKWFPLGQIDSIWTLLDNMYAKDERFQKEISDVLDALSKLDDKIRAEYYPMKKRGKKRV